MRQRLQLWGVLLLATTAAGCGEPVAQWEPNKVFYANQAMAENARDFGESGLRGQVKSINEVLVGLMGTPDAPHVPTLPDVDTRAVLDEGALRLAAGKVSVDERQRARGLYREHCAHCHGVTGNGRGPTAAFLNPYPRDYRMGVFKFKSTPAKTPPTDEDLHRVLINGIAGTSMPSFKLLSLDERTALVNYVRYLSIRGQIERTLIFETANELDEGEPIVDFAKESEDPGYFAESIDLVKSLAADEFQKWIDAEDSVTEIPAAPENWNTPESIARGKQLFYTALTNCSKCHGDAALGDGQVNDYDDWTKELSPKDPEKLELAMQLGALEPRMIRPRNLRQGIYRGGHRPIDLYWRVKNGIAGSPMPSASGELSDDDLWHLIAYVRQLPYESISQPGRHDPVIDRERM